MDVLLAGTTVMVSEPSAVPVVLNPSTQTVCDVLVMEVGVADPSVAIHRDLSTLVCFGTRRF